MTRPKLASIRDHLGSSEGELPLFLEHKIGDHVVQRVLRDRHAMLESWLRQAARFGLDLAVKEHAQGPLTMEAVFVERGGSVTVPFSAPWTLYQAGPDVPVRENFAPVRAHEG
jgi:hypothetical protein